MTDCAPVERVIRQAIGLDAVSIGRGSFERTVRAVRRCASDCEACAAGLSDPASMAELSEQLLVGETWFFRDLEPFVCLPAALRDLPPRAEPWRILSAPCATGEEAYSIAISLLEAGMERFTVDAVDLSAPALAVARAARYGASSFREARDSEYLHECEDGVRVAPGAASMVRFRQGNLCDPRFLEGEPPFDAIFCRNLLIYLTPEARRTVIGHIARLLAPDGVLFTGHAELAALLSAGYAAVSHPGSFACRRAPSPKQAGANAPVRRWQPSVAKEEADWLAMARDLADRGKLDEAVALADRALGRGSAEADAYYLKGLIEQARGDLGAAESWLRKALYLAPRHFDALLQMSALAGTRGDGAQSALYRERARRAEAEQETRRG